MTSTGEIEARGDMDCRELVERVTEHLDAVLPAEDHDRFARHIGECPSCLEILEQFRAVIATTGSLRPADAEAVDPTRRAELLALFRTWRTGGT